MNIFKKLKNYLPFLVFLAGMLPILYNIGTMGLLEPNEALIGSIARYMVDTNDFFTPMANETKHFEMAPGVYWITAFGIKFFGNTELGARFFLSISAGITAVCIFFIAKLFFGLQCAVITCLLLCTSAIFQIAFRILTPEAYCTAFESMLCLSFFYYLNNPSKPLKLAFWLLLSIAFLFSGFTVLLPLIALVFAALYTGQTKSIKSLTAFVPGILTFLFIGLGWYIIQIIINPGLLNFYLITYPSNSFIHQYNGFPFYLYLLLPLIAVFPWTTFLLQELKNKIPEFKEDPAVVYLVTWAFFPFFLRLIMTSRTFVDFMSSLPPLIILTAPSFQNIYFLKNKKDKNSLIYITERRRHNLILTVITASVAMVACIIGAVNWGEARVISQTLIFTGIFWLFSTLIMTAFMIKKLNKSVLVPSAMLIPSLILFTVPAVKGHEPYSSHNYLSSKHILLKKINLLPNLDFINCSTPINGYYFYTGKKVKQFGINQNYGFVSSKANNLIITKDNADKLIKRDSYFIIPAFEKEKISKLLGKSLSISIEESGWYIATIEGDLK